MKFHKFFTAIRKTPTETVQGSVRDFDGERVTLYLFDGRRAQIPLQAIPYALKENEVITARVSPDDLHFLDSHS